MTFSSRMQSVIRTTGTVLCVGLDPVRSRIPEVLKREADPVERFLTEIINATSDLVCSYKLNYAFYSVDGVSGITRMERIISMIREKQIPVILDTKWGDIGHTAEHYAQTAFETLGVDAVTLNPYMGVDSIAPFRAYKDKGSYILCYTSNPSRQDIQLQPVSLPEGTQPLYKHVASTIARWDENQNLGAVVGATAPDELEQIRSLLGMDASILCPGVGAQGGNLHDVFIASKAKEHHNLVVNVSRGVIHASETNDFAEASRNAAASYTEPCREWFGNDG